MEPFKKGQKREQSNCVRVLRGRPSPEAASPTYELAPRVDGRLDAVTGPAGGPLLADVAVDLLAGAVGPPGALHGDAGSVSASPLPQRLAPELPPTALDLYLPPDVDAVLPVVGGV